MCWVANNLEKMRRAFRKRAQGFIGGQMTHRKSQGEDSRLPAQLTREKIWLVGRFLDFLNFYNIFFFRDCLDFGNGWGKIF